MESTKEIQKADLRARIFSSAIHEFAENGYRGATIKNIADGAGASVGVVMKYFGSKEELFNAILFRHTLGDVMSKCKSTEPYDVFSYYLDYLRKMMREDNEYFRFFVIAFNNAFNETDAPKIFADKMTKEFEGSVLEKAIIESQKRHELPEGRSIDIYRLLFTMASTMIQYYARFGLHEADNDTILSAISYKPINPKTERILQEIKSDRTMLLAAVEKEYPLSINCNLTQNTYHMITYDTFLTKKADSRGTFDELIEVGASTIPDTTQREKFRYLFNRQNLLRRFADGKNEVGMFHLQTTDEGEDVWIRTKGVLSQAANGDVLYISISGPLSDDFKRKYDLQNEQGVVSVKKKEDSAAEDDGPATSLRVLQEHARIAEKNIEDIRNVLDSLEKVRSAEQELQQFYDYMLEK